MKQEIIEEMARIIAFDLCPNRSVHAKWGEEAQCYSDNNFAECTKIKNVVDKLYNAGYRKIPENAVVLTEEQMDMLVSRPYYEDQVRKTRKETAEKFARLVEFHSVSTRDEEGREIFTISALGLKEILHEEFGIPYDEIWKGITEYSVVENPSNHAPVSTVISSPVTDWNNAFST